METDLRGIIDCCPTQIAYVEGHHGGKASIKNVKQARHQFYATQTGVCEFCGQEWVAHFSYLTNDVQFRKVTDGGDDASIQDDQG